MTAPRCRWHTDDGRCPDPVAAPGAPGVPELCPRHLLGVEKWAMSRTVAKDSGAAWVAWARRRAAETDSVLKALGVGVLRPPRAADNGRPVIPCAPERR